MTGTKSRPAIIAAGFSAIICTVGTLGLTTPLVYLIMPGFYSIGSAAHGLGIFAFILALPLDFAFYWVVIFTIASLCFSNQRKVN